MLPEKPVSLMPKVCDAETAEPSDQLEAGELCAQTREGQCSEPGSSWAQPDSMQLIALQKGTENLCTLLSPAKERISQYKS